MTMKNIFLSPKKIKSNILQQKNLRSFIIIIITLEQNQ